MTRRVLSVAFLLLVATVLSVFACDSHSIIPYFYKNSFRNQQNFLTQNTNLFYLNQTLLTSNHFEYKLQKVVPYQNSETITTIRCNDCTFVTIFQLFKNSIIFTANYDQSLQIESTVFEKQNGTLIFSFDLSSKTVNWQFAMESFSSIWTNQHQLYFVNANQTCSAYNLLTGGKNIETQLIHTNSSSNQFTTVLSLQKNFYIVDEQCQYLEANDVIVFDNFHSVYTQVKEDTVTLMQEFFGSVRIRKNWYNSSDTVTIHLEESNLYTYVLMKYKSGYLEWFRIVRFKSVLSEIAFTMLEETNDFILTLRTMTNGWIEISNSNSIEFQTVASIQEGLAVIKLNANGDYKWSDQFVFSRFDISVTFQFATNSSIALQIFDVNHNWQLIQYDRYSGQLKAFSDQCVPCKQGYIVKDSLTCEPELIESISIAFPDSAYFGAVLNLPVTYINQLQEQRPLDDKAVCDVNYIMESQCNPTVQIRITEQSVQEVTVTIGKFKIEKRIQVLSWTSSPWFWIILVSSLLTFLCVTTLILISAILLYKYRAKLFHKKQQKYTEVY